MLEQTDMLLVKFLGISVTEYILLFCTLLYFLYTKLISPRMQDWHTAYTAATK